MSNQPVSQAKVFQVTAIAGSKYHVSQFLVRSMLPLATATVGSFFFAVTPFTYASEIPIEPAVFQEAKPLQESSETVASAKEALPDLPRPITSFGAAKIGNVVYAYGGNIDTPHEYYRGCQSGELLKLDLNSETPKWEVISTDDTLQGVALVSHGEHLYRIGGFEATNEKDEPQSLHSVDSFKRFNTKKNQWEALPSLPAGRSSLDAIVDGDLLYVVGGWDMNGDKDTVWHTNALVCNLAEDDLKWETIGKPSFERRAIAITMHGGKLLVAGGMSSDEETLTEVNLYDPKSKQWSDGPSLPGKPLHGFGAAATSISEKAVVSMMDGRTFQLDPAAKEWKLISTSDSPRFFHRLIPFENRVMAIGGTSMETGKYDTCEWIDIPKS